MIYLEKDLSSRFCWSWKEFLAIFILIVLALWLRMAELNRMKSAHLDPDVIHYVDLAQKMKPFTDTGFYSARFGMREPLYLFVAKIFSFLPGPPELNIRFVSCFFSILVVFLTYFLVRHWMGRAVGYIAASCVALHTYLIELSARGLRCEFFTVLFLLLIYWTIIKEKAGPYSRMIGAGILMGLLFLTRTETLLPGILFFLCLPLIEKNKWRFRQALAALAIAMMMFIPHLWAMYQVHGDIFYTNNLNARFYTNLEFAGQPGFPTAQEINQHGMYSGPKVTPFEYFFRFHTLPELFLGNIWGLAKIYLYLPLRYIPTRTWHLLKETEKKVGMWIKYLIVHHPFRTILAILLGIGLLGGLSGLWMTGYRSLYLILIIFQVQTAFLFSVGLETQVVAHTWPVALWVTALFMVYAGNWILDRLHMNLPKSWAFSNSQED